MEPIKLTFSTKGLRELLDHAQAAPEHSRGYAFLNDRIGRPGPGLIVVGDHGIYFMSNGEPGLLVPHQRPGGTRNVCVYANECNPNTMEVDAWWDVKQVAFGGDDGADFIEAKTIDAAIRLAESNNAENVTVGFMPFQPSGGSHGEDIEGACIFDFGRR